MLTKYIIKDKFLQYYNVWLPERKRIMDENEKDHTSIFIKKDGSPADDYVVRNWIGEFEEFLKVPLYPHALRHYYVTLLSKIGIPHQLIKEIVGWSDLSMVVLYDDQEAKDKEWSELDNLKKHLEK